MHSQIDTKKTITYLLFAFGLSLSLYMAFNSTFQEIIMKLNLVQNRTILSKVSLQMQSNAFSFDVIKVRENGLISIEIYKKQTETEETLYNKINLTHDTDGFFLFHNSSINMALKDLDGDAIPEIIVPSFDKNMVAHLDVLKYNKDSDSFNLVIDPMFQID